MCGFVGVFFDQPGVVPKAADIAAMRDLLVHRGPDMAGARLGPGYGLGFRRLAILDLREEANQPMKAPDAPVWLVFNGEIYNHVALRRRLEALGHQFRTTCDTEVLLHAYLQWEEACVDHLEGMYTFAIRDERRDRTVLARDPVGIKPLYVTRVTSGQDGPAWLVASEAKAFAAWPGFRLRFDPTTLPELLAYRYTAGDRTPLMGVRRLLPGHLAVIEGGQLRTRRFFDPRDSWCDAEPTGGTFKERMAALEGVLKEAVGGELESDVPLGTQLSGGIDSGVVTAMAAQARQTPIRTFTVFFGGSVADERPEARQVARRYGAAVREIELRSDRFAELLPELVWHLDEPMNHPNSAAVYSLCKEAKRDVTVLLSGDGPDELLGGYQRYGTILRALAVSNRVPGVMRDAFRRLPRLWLEGRGEVLERAVRGDREELLLQSSAYVMPGELAALGVVGDSVGDYRRQSLASARGSSLRRMLLLDIETYLESVLMRQDKMAMAASVETRVPYLERRVIEACGRLPDEDRRQGRVGKWILRHIAQQYLGTPVTPKASKVGFAVPLNQWLRQDPGLVSRLAAISAGTAPIAAYVPEALVAAVTSGLAAQRRLETELAWMLVSLDIYLEVLASAPARAERVRRLQPAM
jgi:asparagine synthase (glutamine-hydrolysing)